MYKWSLLLLASIAVFQPIASFTERNLVDGRQQCCDHQPHPLHRDTRLAVYGTYRFNKIASEDRRLNDHRNIPETRRHEVRSVESTLIRETESPNSRRVDTGRTARFSRSDRRSVIGFDYRDQENRRVSLDRLSRVQQQRDSQIRTSRDDSARATNEQRVRVSMDARREQRQLNREADNTRVSRATWEGRNVLQRTRNDVGNGNIRNRRVSREMDNMDRRSNVAQPASRRQNVGERVRDVSETRPEVRFRIAEESRRITKDDRTRNAELNRRVTRPSSDEQMRVRQARESGRVTDSRRETRVLNEREREDFRQERRSARPDERFARNVARDVRMKTRSDSAERNERLQTRRIRENINEFENDVRNARRNTAELSRRNVRSVDRSYTRDSVERRFTPRSMESQAARSEIRSSSLTRNERRSLVRNDIRRVQNTRDAREMRQAERLSLNQQTREDRHTIRTNNRDYNGVRSASEDRVMIRSDSRGSRDAVDVRSRNMEQRISRVTGNDRRLKTQASRIEVRSLSRNDEREYDQSRRYSTADRRMERSRREAREGMSLARRTRSIDDVRSERDTRFNDRAETRNQRSSSRAEERRSEQLVRQSRQLEREASRIRDVRINDERIEAVRETRGKEARNARTADSRDRSESRSRLASVESARYRHDFVNKVTEYNSFTFNWQYLFYTLQGIYLCGVIMKMMNETPNNHKTRSWWRMSANAIKID